MITIATIYLHWSENKFWQSTPRKFIAIKNNYFKIENNKIKSIMFAINPNLELEEDEIKTKNNAVYVDNVFF